MDKVVAEKIVTQLGSIIKKDTAVIDSSNNILAKNKSFDGNNFRLDKNKSSKIIPISNRSSKINIYIQDTSANIKSYSKLVQELAKTIVYHSEVLSEILLDDRRKDEFIFDFLRKESSSLELTLREGDFFGIDFKSPKVVIVIFIDEKFVKENEILDQSEVLIHRIKKGIERGLSSFYTSSKENTVSYLGQNLFVVLKDLNSENISLKEHSFKNTLDTMFRIIKSEINKDLIIGVGSYHKGARGIKESFKEALSAARLGRKMWGENKVYHIDDFSFIAPFFINASQVKKREGLFVNFFKDKELLSTLEIFLTNNMNLTKTSKKLKIHRNTLVYRLDKIKKILGLDPRKFNEAVQIRLALILQKFLKYS